MSTDAPNPDEHVHTIFDLSARIGDLLSAHLTGVFPVEGKLLGNTAMEQNAISGIFQYGLLYCALEKSRLNQKGGEPYWDDLAVRLEVKVAGAAYCTSQKIIGPLAPVAGTDDTRHIAQEVRDPFNAYDCTSLSNLEKGIEDTPVQVMTIHIIKAFYPDADHSEVAGRIVELSLEGIRALFVQGGLS